MRREKRGGEDYKSGNGLENKMEKSKRGGESELRDGTMMLYLLDPRRVPALAWPGWKKTVIFWR
jgi:hypothetical protein